MAVFENPPLKPRGPRSEMEAASLCPAGSPAQTRRPGVLSLDSGSGVSQRRAWRLVHEQSSQFLAGFLKQAPGVLWGAGRPSGEFSDQGLPCAEIARLFNVAQVSGRLKCCERRGVKCVPT